MLAQYFNIICLMSSSINASCVLKHPTQRCFLCCVRGCQEKIKVFTCWSLSQLSGESMLGIIMIQMNRWPYAKNPLLLSFIWEFFCYVSVTRWAQPRDTQWQVHINRYVLLSVNCKCSLCDTDRNLWHLQYTVRDAPRTNTSGTRNHIANVLSIRFLCSFWWNGFI